MPELPTQDDKHQDRPSSSDLGWRDSDRLRHRPGAEASSRLKLVSCPFGLLNFIKPPVFERQRAVQHLA